MEPEITESCIDTLRLLSSEKPKSIDQIDSRPNYQHHTLKRLEILMRHKFVTRINGGYISNQLPLIKND